MSGAQPVVLLYVFMACTGSALLYFTIKYILCCLTLHDCYSCDMQCNYLVLASNKMVLAAHVSRRVEKSKHPGWGREFRRTGITWKSNHA
jgi:hypothetical protein